MLDKYCDSQRMFYNYFKSIYDTHHVSHAYMIETRGVSYSFNLALDLAKFFLCDGVYNERICNLVDNGSYSNLKIIGDSASVKKGDIVSLKSEFSMKSLDNRKQVYIIRNLETLNKNAANSLLKFLEEPEDNVIAIFLCDNVINVLPTIVSRCQVVSLINDDNVFEGIFVDLYDSDSDVSYEEFVNEFVHKFFDIYVNIEKIGTSILSDSHFYDLKDCAREFLCFGYYLYFDVINYLYNRDVKCSDYGIDIKKLAGNSKSHDIIKKISVINNFISDLRYNVNINLFLDNFIVSLGSV